MRLHIAIFGRRNAGKSSVLNALAQQNVSIVSEVAGTTTDPVEKSMELLPIGPVLFIDTAGIDDAGSLGALRVAKTYSVFERTDVAILVTEAHTWGDYEEGILEELTKRGIPCVVVFNKTDIFSTNEKARERLKGKGVLYCEICALKAGWDVTALIKGKIIELLPAEWITPPPILNDLVGRDGIVILVIPIDKEAPKGRIILPQVNTLRDLLDKNISVLVTNEKDLGRMLSAMKTRPSAVVTDSQAFEEVFRVVPDDIPVTSFSILFARQKGDLAELARGADAIDTLKPMDRVLIAEACTHHPIGDDIGRVKIPRWLDEHTGGPLQYTICSGHDYPDHIQEYKLIIQCGSCVFNRRECLSRIYKAKAQGVPVTNYGIAIAHLFGAKDRALRLFTPLDSESLAFQSAG